MGAGNPSYSHSTQNPCPVEKNEHFNILPCSTTVNHYMGEGNLWYVHETIHPCRLDIISTTCPTLENLHGTSINPSQTNDLHGVV